MAKLIITIPDLIYNRVLDGLAAGCGYDPEVHGTKANFAKTRTIDFITAQVKQAETQAACRAAMDATHAAVDAEIKLGWS